MSKHPAFALAVIVVAGFPSAAEPPAVDPARDPVAWLTSHDVESQGQVALGDRTSGWFRACATLRGTRSEDELYALSLHTNFAVRAAAFKALMDKPIAADPSDWSPRHVFGFWPPGDNGNAARMFGEERFAFTHRTQTPTNWVGALALLRTAPRLDGRVIGPGARKSRTRAAFELLAASAPDTVLARMLSADEPVVRAYGAEAQAMRFGMRNWRVVAPLLAQTNLVWSQDCCFKSLDPVGNLAAERFAEGAVGRPRLPDEFVAALVERGTNLNARLAYTLARQAPLPAALEDEVRRWATALRQLPRDEASFRGFRAAATALAGYRRERDIPLLSQALADGADRIAELFPHPKLARRRDHGK